MANSRKGSDVRINNLFETIQPTIDKVFKPHGDKTYVFHFTEETKGSYKFPFVLK